MAERVALPRRAARLTLAGTLGVALLGSLVAGVVLASLDATVTPATVVPVTLANGSGCSGGCSTTLNAAGTSATTGTESLPLGGLTNTQVLKVVHGTNAWTVQLRATAASGLILTDSIVLTLTSTSSQSITIGGGTALPLLSASVPLAGGSGATDVAVNARGVCLGTCTLTLEFRIAGGSAVYTYPFTLTVT